MAADQTGFEVDAPVKKPRASEMARQAHPYTDRAGEEPWEGAGALKLTTNTFEFFDKGCNLLEDGSLLGPELRI